jgi:oxygen-independent coproporphyrinogen-3 oxidase
VNAQHVYVHVPFCARRCTYCDFSIAVRARVPVAEYLGALAREAAQADLLPAEPATIYLGGGTPSRLGGDGIAALARLVHAHGALAEFTLEANPEDVTRDAVRTWTAAGVNRLSLGVQSFDAGVLAWMHRTHDVPAIAAAVRAAREGGIANLSIDLIFALPESLGRDWGADLASAVELEPDHISLYGLTVEEGTPLARQIGRGQTAAADDARWEEEYLRAHEALGAAGFAFYEVSNAARPGRQAVHNRAYWTLAPYVGLGPSAHSFDGTTRRWNEPAYARWVRMLGAGQSPVSGHEILGRSQRELEQLYLGLRTVDGVELSDESPPRLRARVDSWVASGWAELRAGASARPRVGLTPLGWLRLDALVASV